MAFIRKNFSPVGAQARRGVVPQVFSYTTPDALASVKASGYFPNTGGLNGMLNTFGPDDKIHVVSSTGGTSIYTIIFIDNDGTDGNAITTVVVDISAG